MMMPRTMMAASSVGEELALTPVQTRSASSFRRSRRSTKRRKARTREERAVVGELPRPFVHKIVGVTTLSNHYKSEVTAFNKAGVDADKAPTEMKREAQAVQRLERLRRIRADRD
jgi:hypothetical protein